MTESRPTNREALERLVVELLGISQRCTDVACQRDLMRLANELVHLIEGSEQSKAEQSHWAGN
jgi:hypothetical protein